VSSSLRRITLMRKQITIRRLPDGTLEIEVIEVSDDY